MRKQIVWLLLGGLALGCSEGFDLLNPIGPTLPPVAPIEDYFGRWRNVDQEDGNYLTASISPIGGDAQVELLTGGDCSGDCTISFRATYTDDVLFGEYEYLSKVVSFTLRRWPEELQVISVHNYRDDRDPWTGDDRMRQK